MGLLLETEGIEISHHNLANYLGWLGGDRAGQRAHRLAAALIDQLSGRAHDLAGTVHVLAAELPGDDAAARLPATVAPPLPGWPATTDRVGQVPR